VALTQNELALVLRNLPTKYLKAFQDGEITADQLEPYARSLGIKATPAKADFSNVKHGTSAATPSANKRALDSLGTSAQAGFESRAAGAAQLGADAPDQEAEQAAKPWYRRDVLDFVGMGPDERAKIDSKLMPQVYDAMAHPLDALSDIYNAGHGDVRGVTNRIYAASNQDDAAKAAEERAAATAHRTASATALDSVGRGHGLVEASQQLAESGPTSLVSLIPNPVIRAAAAPIAGQDQYYAAYDQARQAGLPPKEARAAAQKSAFIDAAWEATGAGEIAHKIPGLNKVVRRLTDPLMHGPVVRTVAGAATQAVGEGTEEAGSSVTSDIANLYDASTRDDATGKYAASQAPLDHNGNIDPAVMAQRAVQAFKVGALAGGAIGSGTASFQVMAEQGKLHADALAANARARSEGQKRRDAIRAARAGQTNTTTNPQGDLFGDAPRGNDIAPTPAPADFNQRADAAQADVRSQVADMFAPTQTDMFGGDPATAPAAPIVQSRGGNTYYNPNDGTSGRKTLDAARQTAETALTRERQKAEVAAANERAKAEKARKSAFQAERRSRLQAILDDAKSQASTPAEQAAIAAPRIEELNNTFTLDSFQMPEVTGAPKRKRGQKAPTPTVTAAAPAAAPVVEPTPAGEMAAGTGDAGAELAPQSEVDAIRNAVADAPLSQQSPGPTTNVTASRVLDHITSRMSGGKKNQAAKMIGDGNVVIVDDISEVPGNVDQRSDAVYTGDKTYIVANKVDPKNIMGATLEALAHETKHAADVGAGPQTRANMGNFIGAEANARINAKIEALAAQGDEVAQRTVAAAKAGSNSDSSYALELPAYFINAQRAVRAGKGVHARIAGDIVSAVRTAVKGRLGNADVNLDDVAYLSDKLVHQVAAEGHRTTGSVNAPLPMIMSGGAGHAQAVNEGRTWLSADGKRKYEIDDSKSRMTIPDQVDGGRIYKAGEVIQHDAAFAEFPELANVDVQFVNDPYSGYGGYYRQPDDSHPNGLIEINLGDSNGPANNFNSFTHRNMVHELQHAAQFMGQTTGGAAPNDFLSPEGRKIRQQLIELNQAIDGAEAIGMDRADYADLRQQHDDLLEQYKPHGIEAEGKYKKVLGEQEAYSTVDRIPLTMQERQDDTLTREATVTKRDGGTLTPRGKLLAANLSGPQQYFIARGDFKQLLADFAKARGQNIADVADSVHIVDGKLYAEGEDVGTVQEFLDSLRGTPVDGAQVEPIHNMGVLSYSPRAFIDGIKALRRPKDRVTKELAKLLGGFGGLGRALGNMKENADGTAAMYAHRGMNLFSQTNIAIKSLAKEWKAAGRYATVAEAHEAAQQMLDGKIKAITALPTESERKSAYADLVRRYPALRPVEAAQQEIAQLTRVMIKQMLDTNPNPTVDELTLMKTMMNNTYRYTTRMYAAFQGKAGEARNAALYKSYEKARDAQGRIPEKHRAAFNIVDNAVRFIIDNDLTIPDYDGMAKMAMDDLMKLHNTWIVGDAARVRQQAHIDARANGLTINDAKQAEREVLIQNLLTRQNSVSADETLGKAEDIIKSMLNLADNNSSIAAFYRNFAQDRSILDNKTNLPEALRELYGEIKDPATLFAVTIAKQGELAARTRLLLDIRDRGIGKWVIPAAAVGTKPEYAQFSETLGGKAFGPLAGYRTTPELKAAIGDNLEVFNSLSTALNQAYANSNALVDPSMRWAMGKITSLAAKQKMLSVVWSLYNIGTNAMGSPLVLIANGINPASPLIAGMKYALGNKSALRDDAVLTGLRTGATVIWDTATDGRIKLTDDAEEAIKYGILDSARVQEIRRTPQEFVRDLISTQPKAISATRKGLGRASRTLVEGFAMSDAWVKIAAFKDRVDTLKKFYDAEGITKSDSDIKKEAADTVKDTNITYARTGAAVRAVERIGITTFLPYFVSVPRAVGYNVINGVKDMIRATTATTPQGKLIMGMAGARRAGGAVASTYGAVLLMQALAAAWNSDDDKDKLDKAKKLMLPDARFADSFFLGTDKDGHPMFARFSRIDPFGPMTDFMRIAMDDSTPPEDRRREMVNMFKDMMITNRVLVAAGKVALDVLADEEVKDKKTKIERVAPGYALEAKNLIDAIPGLDYSDANSVMQFMDSFTPGMINLFDPKNTGVDNPHDHESAVMATMISWTGGRLDKADPGSAAFAAGKDLQEARDTGRKRQAEAFSAGMDHDRMLSMFMEDANNEYVAARRVYEIYDGMVDGLGMSPREAQKLLKDNASLKESDIAAIRQGRVDQTAEEWIPRNSRILSQKSQTQRGSAGGEELNADQKRQIKTYLDSLKALGYKVRE
jgi:hypothetical protein